MTEDFKNKILETIEQKHIAPKPRWHFLVREYGMWCAVFLSVLASGLSVGVVLYAIVNSDVVNYHETGFPAFVVFLVFVWLTALLVAVSVAVFNALHTKRGYRYPLYVVLGILLLLSFTLGSALFAGGYGKSVDETFARYVPAYESVETNRRAFWYDPSQGRLVGKVVSFEEPDVLIVKDPQETRWVVRMPEHAPKPLHTIHVRVIEERKPVVIFMGSQTGTSTFEACMMRPMKFVGAKPLWHGHEEGGEHERELFLMRKEKCERAVHNLFEQALPTP